MTNAETNDKAAGVAEQAPNSAPEKASSKKGASQKNGAPKGRKTAKGAKTKKEAKGRKKAAKSARVKGLHSSRREQGR